MAQKENVSVFGSNDKREELLFKLFAMLKERENMAFVKKPTRFNNTELRLLTQVVLSKMENKRMISTQLAKSLGITRSAVSQIVQRLEKDGVVVRLPDEVDRKIAYVELSNDMMSEYNNDLEKALTFINDVVLEMGEEKFNRMYEYFMEFTQIAKRKMEE